MKKLFSIVLAVVMVLGVATTAMAFSWAKPVASADSFGYSIDVIKFTRQTAALGSAIFNEDSNATAVNGADVYFAIKLVVPDLDADKDIRKNAKVDIKGTAIQGLNGLDGLPIDLLGEGIYYYTNIMQEDGSKLDSYDATHAFKTVDDTAFWYGAINSKLSQTPVLAFACRDTSTAKVYAKVYSDRSFADGAWFNVGSYDVAVTDAQVIFSEAADTVGTGNVIAKFHRNSDGKVTSVEYGAADVDGQKLIELYQWLNDGNANAIFDAIKAGEMYMTNKNLRVAFGFTYSVDDTATWNANSTPIILDPTVSIPKTGDNASVLGFAMIMVAIVAAAVAVKKVNA